MRVFFRFGQTQLVHALPRDHLAQAHAHGFLGKGHRQGKVGVIGRHGGHGGQLRHPAPLESGEVRIHERLGKLAHAVGAEIEEEQAVAVLQGGDVPAFQQHGLDEFVADALGIGVFHSLDGIRGMAALAVDHEVPDPGHAPPALVAVHGVEAPRQAGHAHILHGDDLFQEAAHIGGAAPGRGVAPVHEAVDAHRHPGGKGHGAQGHQMVDVAVHAAVGEQARQMQAAAAAARLFQHVQQHGVVEQGAVLKGQVDARHVLIDDASRADVEVPHLGVAHIAGRQAHFAPGGGQAAVRTARRQVIQMGRGRHPGGIAFPFVRQAPAVKDEQQGGGHARGSLLRAAAAAPHRLSSW